MTYIRTDFTKLNPTLKQAYADGVKAMKALSVSNPADPRGWTYQSNIHGIPGAVPPPLQKYWSKCQHQTYFFLSWHRMYIYYFERIVPLGLQEQEASRSRTGTTPTPPRWGPPAPSRWSSGAQAVERAVGARQRAGKARAAGGDQRRAACSPRPTCATTSRTPSSTSTAWASAAPGWRWRSGAVPPASSTSAATTARSSSSPTTTCTCRWAASSPTACAG
jgi:hypothetical protein